MNHNVYILLSMSGTKFSRLLKLFSSGSEFIHVSISIDEDKSKFYSFGRKVIWAPWIAGFIEESPYSGIFGKYNPHCEILKVSLNDEQYSKLIKNLDKFKADPDRYGYDYLGLVLLWLNRMHTTRYYYTCTEFVAYLLSTAGVDIAGKHFTCVRPVDYYKVIGISSIYKGRLHDFYSGGLACT